MKKYRATKTYADGGKPPVAVAVTTITPSKVAGVKTQTYASDDYIKRRDELMEQKAQAYLKSNPSIKKFIPAVERKIMQDDVRTELTKQGVRQVATTIKRK